MKTLFVDRETSEKKESTEASHCINQEFDWIHTLRG